MPKKSTTPDTLTVNDLAAEMLDLTVLWGSDVLEERLPFTAHHQSAESRVLVVAGPNCSGKSLFVESLRSFGRTQHELSSVCVSIRERTGSGLSEMAGMRRMFMFGNESEQSTGATSVRVVGKAFDTVNAHLEKKETKRNLLVLDEPELGLSDGYCRAMGAYLAQRAQQMHSASWGLVVVTHSKALVDALAQELGPEHIPGFVHMNSPLTLSEWTGSQESFSVEQLLDLAQQDHALRRAVHKVWG